MSIQQAGMEMASRQTPPHLQEQAAPTTREHRHNRWPMYAAAAVVVVGIGIHTIYRSQEDVYPFSAEAQIQLAMLDTELNTHNLSWSQISFERLRGTSPVKIEISDRAKAAVALGAAMIQLALQWEYANNLPNAQYQLRMVEFALKQMPESGALQKNVLDLANGQMNQSAESVLPTLQQNIARFIATQADTIETFYVLGQWLRSSQITLRAATQLSIPLPAQTMQLNHFRQRWDSLQGPPELTEKLTELLAAIKRQDAPKTILIRVEDLLNALSIS
jgi:hypothetical protein